jgi:type I restriction enzyme S subunit
MDLNLIQNNLPQSWALVELKDLVENPKKDIVDGPFGSNLKANEYTASGVPVFKIQNIKANQFINKNISYIKKEKAKELHRHSFKSGDLIITKLGNPLGLCCKVPDTYSYGIIVADLMRFRPSIERVFDKYIIHAINSFFIQNQFKVITKGTTRPRVNLTIVRNIKVPYPPLPEQHQIVAKIEELFSELDNGIESLKKAREQLKTYRQAVLKYAFEGKLTKEWRTLQRLAGNAPKTAEKLLEQIKTERERHYQKQLEDWGKACELAKADGKKKPARPRKPKELPPLTEKELTELPELPEGWSWVRTEQVGHIETGTTPSKKSPENYGKEHPFYKPTDLNEGKNVRKAHDNLSEVGYSKARILPINSILVTCIGATIGKTGIIREEGAFNQQINAIIPFNYIIPVFVYYQAICQFFQNQIIFKASSTTLPILNKSKFENLFFALTSYEEQQAIVSEIESRLSVCDKIEQTVEDSLKKAEALRQSILKKAFAGELTKDWREKHPELITGENSAEKLLEKIKAEKRFTAEAQRTQRKTKKGKKQG